jgi:Cap4 dsDNA endonuclease
VTSLPLTEPPPEDDGARTSHRYLFQYCCAAARLLAALATGTSCELICEWHEDYLVVGDDGTEAVSVKHREDHRPAWTIASLTSEDGKLGHLLDTFRRAEGITCSFESNRAHTAHDLWCDDPARRGAARSDLGKRLGVPHADVDEFVDNLSIITPPAPGRHHIASTYAANYASPALDRLGIAGLSASQAMHIAASMVGDASRDRIADDGWIAVVASKPQERATVLAHHQLEARRISSDELRNALVEAERAQIPRLDSVSGDAPPETTMSLKLEAGGLGPSVIDTARRRRRLWYSHRAEIRDIGEREAELRSLQEWVQDQANSSESLAIATGDTPYGPQMYEQLMTRLRANDAPPPGTRRVDSDPALLSGAAFELTDACSIWWSPRSALEDSDGEH